MVDSALRILVVGAGIAGLAAARALRLAGFRPQLVERESATTVAGQGIYLPGNAARALRQLGLDEPMQPLGAVITCQRVYDSRGRLLREVPADQLWPGVGECRALPRAELHRVLLTGAGGEVRFDTAVQELSTGDPVTVTFAGAEAAEYDLVIGADGRRSTIRRLAGLGGAPTPLGQLAFRWMVSGGPAVDSWSTLLGRRAAFVVMPVGNRQLYCYAEQVVEPGQGPADPREHFSRFGGPVPELLAGADKAKAASLEEVTIERWSRGPVVLVGDAAHATSPSLAQGAAMALEDALVLADSLKECDSVPAALARYERRRRPRTEWVRGQARRRDRARDLPPVLRDPMVRLLGDRVFPGGHAPLLSPH